MTPEELLQFISETIPTFKDFSIVESGTAYHYTSHFEKILECGKFLGAPIDKNLDRTQMKVISDPAIHDPGVVFAYESLKDAKEEGFGCDIIEIQFSKAVRTIHKQEAAIGAPHSLLILNGDITSFKKVARGDKF